MTEPGERTYGQYCGVARALDLVGERWALLVVRELLLGPQRFTDLSAGLPGVSTNVLAARLRRLEARGVVRRRVLPPPAASAVYELTEYGRDLEPALLALGRWGARTLGERAPDQALRSRWLALALKSFFRRDAADGVAVTYELRLRDGTYRLDVDGGEVSVEPGEADGDARLVLEADDDALVGFLAGALDAEQALGSGGLRLVSGEPAELDRFARLFDFAQTPPA